MVSTEKTRCLHPELWLFAGIILLCNLHLLSGAAPPAGLIFFPDAWAERDLLGALAHPFVHVTWYHLLLDASAFLILYAGLLETRPASRLVYAAASAAGSVLLAVCLAPGLSTYGLCGLSGIAHGLMAVSALELMKTKNRSIGIACLLIVLAKSIFEAFTGRVFFSFLHFNLMGVPVAISHLGGVIGGISAYGILAELKRRTVN